MSRSRHHNKQRYRSLFLSDFHLGSRGCSPGPILDFLQSVQADAIYLVGDILDLWHGGPVQWGDIHAEIIETLEAHAEAGTRIVYLPGNHDAALRSPGMNFLSFELTETALHVGADGQRYLIVHGDQCDARILRWHAMTRFGSRMDALFRGIDAWLRRRRDVSETERTLIQLAIEGINHLIARGSGYEHRLIALASEAGVDGIICGHSHKPALRDVDGMTYANCGDWVDSLTALAEDSSGALQLLQWGAEPAAVPETGPRPAVAKVRA